MTRRTLVTALLVLAVVALFAVPLLVDGGTSDFGGTDAAVPADGALGEGAAQVTEVLRRPEITALLERFDAQVDERLARRG